MQSAADFTSGMVSPPGTERVRVRLSLFGGSGAIAVLAPLGHGAALAALMSWSMWPASQTGEPALCKGSPIETLEAWAGSRWSSLEVSDLVLEDTATGWPGRCPALGLEPLSDSLRASELQVWGSTPCRKSGAGHLAKLWRRFGVALASLWRRFGVALASLSRQIRQIRRRQERRLRVVGRPCRNAGREVT